MIIEWRRSDGSTRTQLGGRLLHNTKQNSGRRRKLQFVKIQALGNDFILVEKDWIKDLDIQKWVPLLCDRHFGIGSDGLLILDQTEGLYQMKMFNPDGTPAMCGNGLRAFVRYLLDEGYVKEEWFEVMGPVGKNTIEIERDKEGGVKNIRANLGFPALERDKIPFARPGVEPALEEPIEVEGKTFRVALVSMGNPHAVIFVEDVEAVDVAFWGPKIENHFLFPQRTNVEFVQWVDEENLIMRVWERGAGITLACGTGTAATVVAAALKGLTGPRVKVHLLGGILEIEYQPGGEVWMIGPASEVFRGNINLQSLYIPPGYFS